MTLNSYTRAVLAHDWAIQHLRLIARVRFDKGVWFTEVATARKGWVRYE